MSTEGIDPRKYKAMLLQAPPGQLDPSLFPLIQKWDENPRPIQVLEVLDHCVHGAMTSDFATSLVNMIYDNALTLHKETHDDVVKLATWREQ